MKIKLIYDKDGKQIFINEETGEKLSEITSIGNEKEEKAKKSKKHFTI